MSMLVIESCTSRRLSVMLVRPLVRRVQHFDAGERAQKLHAEWTTPPIPLDPYTIFPGCVLAKAISSFTEPPGRGFATIS